MSDKIAKTATNAEKTGPEAQEFHVEIRRITHGYVRVQARNKNEARKVVETMNEKQLLGYFKSRYEFVNIGEATEATSDD